MARKAKDIPLAEVTMRKYEPPYRMSKREKVRKLCLSLGLLQPGEARDSIVDILQLLLARKNGLLYNELEDKLIAKRKRAKLPLYGVTASNIHRQLRRLKEMGLVDKHLGRYRIAEKMSLSRLFEERIVGHYLDGVIKRVKEYCDELS